MDYFGIATIIVVVVGAVRFVHMTAFKDGIYVGKNMGRLEILEENLARTKINEGKLEEEKKIVDMLTQETRTRYFA